jgi:predicted phage tail protein
VPHCFYNPLLTQPVHQAKKAAVALSSSAMRKLEVQLAGLRVDIISTQDEKEACVAAEDFGGAEKAKEKLAQLEAEQQRITAAMQPKEVGVRGWHETRDAACVCSSHSSHQPPSLN